jgi:hypothetical protein
MVPDWLQFLIGERGLIRGCYRYVIAPWRMGKKTDALQEHLSRVEKRAEDLVKRVSEWEFRNPHGAEHYLGARWAHVPREARNVPFCETCFQAGKGELHRMKEGIVENDKQLLFCSRNGTHRIGIPVKDYGWAVHKMGLERAS